MNVKQQPGELLTINKNILTIAPEYQRAASPSLVRSIKKNWNWRAAGVITINVRDNLHYVIDGQHRVLASKDISEITHLPCLVFKNLSLAEEAETLAEINSRRKSMSSIDKFRANLIMKDETAVYVNNRVTANKFHVSNTGFQSANCVKTLCDLAKKSKTRFDRVIDFTCKLCSNRQLNRRLLDAIDYVDEKGLLDDRLKGRLMTVGYDTLLISIKKSNMAFGTLEQKSCAHGLMDAANRGMRNRFEFEA